MKGPEAALNPIYVPKEIFKDILGIGSSVSLNVP